jgi:hypothetical protein
VGQLGDNGLKSVLSKLGFSPQSRKEREEVIFLFVPIQPEQIKSPLPHQNTDLLQSPGHQMQSESIPEGLSLVIQSRLWRDWITKENISPRSLRLSGKPGFLEGRMTIQNLNGINPAPWEFHSIWTAMV